ncbi:hypothetical protein I350_05414 [Cryptococcus amylolentus CBS 6273]|uniref:Serine/threonine-protein kinase Tel1 n=1 Tax=Cryptococcus amylolentus CBS 6273 TaxID=1296118 RepID=A0A1E3JVF1_9TREE|nr:hypothetical protein I350_05414 [Cryptococcus amylolentus CBS 6273]
MGILKRLEEALELYRSDKIKERSQGHDQLRDLLHNRDTILRFADAAQESSARPWISLFSCVMNAVHSEKVLMSKKDTAAQKQRLSNAISIARLVAEQSVHHIGRLPLLALIGTMRQQLLWSRKIYEPALVDYSKAIVTLLSHPPHLEVLDRASWLSLMSISFAVILGDEVKCESDDDPDTLGVMLELKIVEEEERSGKRHSLSTKQIPVSNSNESFVKLVPILLSSGTAPIIPPSLNQGDILPANQRVGLGLLLKLRRFFVAQPHVTVYHPHLLKALNILLSELELNHRETFNNASIKILPQLVTLWSNSVRSQDRSVVDQVVIAIRTILPHITHPAMEAKYVAEIRSSLETLWEVLPREAGSKRLEYLDMGCLRLKSRIQGRTNLVPFESVSFSAGYHFSVSQTFSWAALELYSDCCKYLYLTRSSDVEIGRNGSTPKRRKVEHTLSSLLSAVNLGKFESRLLALQTLIFLIGRQWSSLEMETQQAVFHCLHALLNDENEVLQSWAFLGLATAAVISTAGSDFHTDKSDPTLNTHTSLWGNRKAPSSNDEIWNKVWSHAVRKCYVPATSRAASHLTAILIQLNLLDHNTIVGGIRSLLQSVEIEGPPASLDSVCVLHTIALEMAQSDIRLYSLGLEEKVLAWLEKIWAGDKAVRSEGSDGRLEQRAPSDLLGLLSAISGVQSYSLVEPTVDEFVPESAVSKHLFEEAATQSIRDIVLYQKFPQPPSTVTHMRAVTIGAFEPENSSPLESRCLRLSLLMSSMMRNDLVQEQGKSFIIHNHLAERTRRSIDLVVLVYAYQASLCLNGYTVHTASLQAATRLLGSLLPTMASHDLPLPDLDLIWRGLRCLVADTGKDYDVDRWPILVLPGIPSGIRTDLLPQQQGQPASRDSEGSPTATSTQCHSTFPSDFPSTYMSQEGSYPVLPQDSTGDDALVHAIWRLPTVTTTLKGLFEPCLQIARRSRSSDPVQSQLRAAGGHDSDDDDDFSGMSVEDAAVLPSKETPEKRASASILHSVVCFRLKGGKLAQNAPRAYKDPSLINCFLQSDAPHSLAVGLALCEAIHKGWLRINLEAVQLVVDELNGLIGSYSYRYDEAAWSFAFAFLRCSASAWLLKADTKLFEACMKLIHFVAARVLHGTPMSWRLKYDLLQFLEDFTSYEKAIQLWANYPTEDTRNEEIAEENRKINELWVLAARALRDDDIRIRVRASTMAGNAFYRPMLGLSQHPEFYQSCSRQSQDEAQIDHFVTDILWNVNCCVASAAVRQTAVLMLCNLAIDTSAGLPYIQAGLSAAAGRLGLSSASTLCLPYCAGALVAQAHTNTANSLSRILGFSDRNALHVACLKACGPYLLHQEQFNFYSRACESIHLPTEEVIRQNFPEIASVIMTLSWSVNQRDKNIESGLVRLAALPGINTVETAKELLEDHVDAVRAYVWELIDLNTTPEDITSLLKREKIETATFREIQPPDMESSPGSLASTALQPSASVDVVYVVSSSLATRHGTSSSINGMVFAAILRLTFLINEAFLVSEQDRHLRALFCLIAINAKAFRQKMILGTFLHEVLALLDQPNLSHTVLPMVKWGFTRLTTLAGTGPTNTTNLFLQLGRVWSVSHRAVSVPRQQHLAHLLEDWITSALPGWETSTVKDSFLQAAALWPDDVRSRLNTPLKSPTLWELRGLSEANIVGTGSELCKQFKKLAEDDYTGKVAPAFMASAFWTIKSDMGREWDPEGISAFQELLYMAGGEIRSAPPIGASPRKPTANGAHDVFLGISEFTVRLLDDHHHGVRAAAYRALQGMKPHISAAGIETRLSPVEHNLYEILEPLVLAQSQKEYRLSDILDRSSWDSLLCNTEAWALDLARLLCDVASHQDPFYLSINPLLSSQVPLRHLLPYLVHAVLICDKSNKASPKNSRILARYFEQVVQSSQASTETIQTVIDISLYLRQYQAPHTSGKEDNEWLSIDLVTLSQAAIRCDSYVTALLFLELARDQPVPPDLTRSNIQRILYDVYSNVDEPDGFYGIQNNDARDALSRRLKHEGSSWAALAWDGAIFNAAGDGPSTILPVVRNLHEIGFSRLASSVVSQAENATNATTEDPFFAELGWRTGNWTLPLSTEAKATPSGLLYEALSAVHKSRDLNTARVAIDEAVRISIEELSKASREKMSSIESITTNLLCLRELQEWNRQQSEDSPKSTVFRAGESFEDSGTRFEFSIAEKIIAVRMSLIQSTKHRESQNLIGDMESPGFKATVEAEKACHLQLCKLALKDGRMQTAINSITAAQRLEDTSRGSEETQDLFCEVLWKQGEHGLAIQLVETRIKEEKGSSRDLNGVVALRDKLALWTSSARLRSAEEIESTFEDAVSRVKKFQLRKSEHARLYYHFACFSHQQHISLANSSEFKRLEEREKRRQAGAIASQALGKGGRRQSKLQKGEIHLAKFAEFKEAQADSTAFEDLKQRSAAYLRSAQTNYIKTLCYSDEFDDTIMSLVTLWFENDQDQEANQALGQQISTVPSYKFIFLAPQITARLNQNDDKEEFAKSLHHVVLRVCQDHPYHILYQVITLAHAPSVNKADHGDPGSDQAAAGRAAAASNILEKLSSLEGKSLSSAAAKSMQQFVDIAVDWTLEPIIYDENAEGVKKRSGSLQKDSILNKTPQNIPIATKPPPIDCTCKYDNIALFSRYQNTFTIAGGISTPKVMTCYDNKGHKHTQLFKRDDGFRQDTVMEQVFERVNHLLQERTQSKRRHLRFRTYTVVAFPLNTGVIDFVPNTMPIGDWLRRAHTKYRPHDITASNFSKRLAEPRKQPKVDKSVLTTQLVEIFKTCKKNFRPVMRHFFTEKHRDPVAWLSMRTSYGRSVAVTSMTGWVLGIGDRHCSNILIDNITGELVHIDFGVAFEAGTLLPIAEHVPFRLTDDLVDALGITGVEGVMRRCSQLALQVLIDSSDVILTILEVFKHDPLHSWSSAEKQVRAQGGGHDVLLAHEKSDRVLGKVREKLSKELSVEYRVNQLIQEARDVNNLATIYTGKSEVLLCVLLC